VTYIFHNAGKSGKPTAYVVHVCIQLSYKGLDDVSHARLLRKEFIVFVPLCVQKILFRWCGRESIDLAGLTKEKKTVDTLTYNVVLHGRSY